MAGDQINTDTIARMVNWQRSALKFPQSKTTPQTNVQVAAPNFWKGNDSPGEDQDGSGTVPYFLLTRIEPVHVRYIVQQDSDQDQCQQSPVETG